MFRNVVDVRYWKRAEQPKQLFKRFANCTSHMLPLARGAGGKTAHGTIYCGTSLIHLLPRRAPCDAISKRSAITRRDARMSARSIDVLNQNTF